MADIALRLLHVLWRSERAGLVPPKGGFALLVEAVQCSGLGADSSRGDETVEDAQTGIAENEVKNRRASIMGSGGPGTPVGGSTPRASIIGGQNTPARSQSPWKDDVENDNDKEKKNGWDLLRTQVMGGSLIKLKPPALINKVKQPSFTEGSSKEVGSNFNTSERVTREDAAPPLVARLCRPVVRRLLSSTPAGLLRVPVNGSLLGATAPPPPTTAAAVEMEDHVADYGSDDEFSNPHVTSDASETNSVALRTDYSVRAHIRALQAIAVLALGYPEKGLSSLEAAKYVHPCHADAIRGAGSERQLQKANVNSVHSIHSDINTSNANLHTNTNANAKTSASAGASAKSNAELVSQLLEVGDAHRRREAATSAVYAWLIASDTKVDREGDDVDNNNSNSNTYNSDSAAGDFSNAGLGSGMGVGSTARACLVIGGCGVGKSSVISGAISKAMQHLNGTGGVSALTDGYQSVAGSRRPSAASTSIALICYF